MGEGGREREREGDLRRSDIVLKYLISLWFLIIVMFCLNSMVLKFNTF